MGANNLRISHCSGSTLFKIIDWYNASGLFPTKALIALVDRLSLSVGLEMVLNRDLRLFYLILNFLKFLANSADPDQMPHSVASDMSALFANVPVQVLQKTLNMAL